MIQIFARFLSEELLRVQKICVYQTGIDHAGEKCVVYGVCEFVIRPDGRRQIHGRTGGNRMLCQISPVVQRLLFCVRVGFFHESAISVIAGIEGRHVRAVYFRAEVRQAAMVPGYGHSCCQIGVRAEMLKGFVGAGSCMVDLNIGAVHAQLGFGRSLSDIMQQACRCGKIFVMKRPCKLAGQPGDLLKMVGQSLFSAVFCHVRNPCRHAADASLLFRFSLSDRTGIRIPGIHVRQILRRLYRN